MTFRNYLIANAIGVALLNVTINGGYTWFLWSNEENLELQNIGTDIAMTPIWIGLLSVLLGTVFIRKALSDGTMLRDAGIKPPSIFQRLPRSILKRSVVVAALCALVFAFPLTRILPLIGDGMLTPTDAIGTKVIVTIVFSLLIVPLIVYATTADSEKAGTMRVG